MKKENCEWYNEQPTFEEGEVVEVSHLGSWWEKRIYLHTTKEGKHLCVNCQSESDYRKGDRYTACSWRHIRRVEAEEMTLEQVCKELGRNIKIVKS